MSPSSRTVIRRHHSYSSAKVKVTTVAESEATMPSNWEEAAQAALIQIYTQVRKKPRAELTQLRADLDGFIEEMFHAAAGFDKAKIQWAVIGADALEIAIQRGEPFDITDVHTTVCGKQRDYGPENIRRFGRQGLMVRMHDKVARLENLLQNDDGGGKPNNESIQDNLLDVVGYATVAIMWESMTFLLPMKNR